MDLCSWLWYNTILYRVKQTSDFKSHLNQSFEMSWNLPERVLISLQSAAQDQGRMFSWQSLRSGGCAWNLEKSSWASPSFLSLKLHSRSVVSLRLFTSLSGCCNLPSAWGRMVSIGCLPGIGKYFTSGGFNWGCFSSSFFFFRRDWHLYIFWKIMSVDSDYLTVLCCDCRWHSWSVLWPVAVVRVWRVPTREQLLIFGWLRGSGQTVLGNHLPVASLQDQVPRKFLLVAGQPRMCQHQQDLRLLWWM